MGGYSAETQALVSFLTRPIYKLHLAKTHREEGFSEYEAGVKRLPIRYGSNWR